MLCHSKVLPKVLLSLPIAYRDRQLEETIAGNPLLLNIAN